MSSQRYSPVFKDEAEPNDAVDSADSLIFPARVAAEKIAADIAGSVSGIEGAVSDFDDFFIFSPPEPDTYVIYLCNEPLVCKCGTVTDRSVLALRDTTLESMSLMRLWSYNLTISSSGD